MLMYTSMESTPTAAAAPVRCNLYRAACDQVPEGCLLLNILNGQAEMGGQSNDEATPGVGPVMPREMWNDYLTRTEDVARMGCKQLGALLLASQALTAQKEARGDFVEVEVPEPAFVTERRD